MHRAPRRVTSRECRKSTRCDDVAVPCGFPEPKKANRQTQKEGSSRASNAPVYEPATGSSAPGRVCTAPARMSHARLGFEALPASDLALLMQPCRVRKMAA